MLTLADVRLAALRLAVVEAVVVGLCVGGGLGLRDTLPFLLFVAWLLGPPAHVERACDRRGLPVVGVGGAAGVVAGLLAPAAVLQADWLDTALRAGTLSAPVATTLDLDSLVAAPVVVVAALLVVGCAAVFMTLERRTTPATTAEAVLALVALALSFGLVLPYLVAAAIDRAVAREEPPAC